MKTAPNPKFGRPRKPYLTSWGEAINGLRRRPNDGRWEITAQWGKGRKFTEPDERLAVAKFRRMELAESNATVSLPEAVASLGSVDFAKGLASVAAGRPVPPTAPVRLADAAAVTVRVPLSSDEPTTVAVHGRPVGEWAIQGDRGVVSNKVLQAELWAYVRSQLIERPAWVAEQVGIPEVARLADLPIRQPSRTLKEVGEIYQKQGEATVKWKEKVALHWKEFRRAVDAETLRDLTVEQVADYGAKVKAKGKSPTYAVHRFGSIKTIVSFARKHGIDPADCRHAQDCMAVLTAPKKNKPQPSPISRADLQRLLGHVDDEMKLAILLGLNLCMYGSEVAALKWSEIDLERGTVVTHRSKTHVIRVGVLWQRTIELLEARPKPKVGGSVLGVADATIRRRFWKLRQAAGVGADVQFQHLRDGAYTAAAECSEVELTHVEALAGHSTGIADHYLARRPQIVKKACEAIEAYYFG